MDVIASRTRCLSLTRWLFNSTQLNSAAPSVHDRLASWDGRLPRLRICLHRTPNPELLSLSCTSTALSRPRVRPHQPFRHPSLRRTPPQPQAGAVLQPDLRRRTDRPAARRRSTAAAAVGELLSCLWRACTRHPFRQGQPAGIFAPRFFAAPARPWHVSSSITIDAAPSITPSKPTPPRRTRLRHHSALVEKYLMYFFIQI